MIEIVQDSIFNSKEKYLCHQCNCVTKRAAHLSKDVFTRYPYANIYSTRTNPDMPGFPIIKGNGSDQRYVVNILGQYYPGSPKYPDSNLDGTKAREKYFYHALLRLAKVPNLESLAFPYAIGCGAAGGNWDHYLSMITNFANYIEKTQNAKVFIYQLKDDMANSIKFYKSEPPYGFLNNFARARMFIYGQWWDTVEAAYQASKTLDKEEREKIRLATSPREARDLGQKVKLRETWDEIKDQVMYECLMGKFLQHPQLRKQLMATGDAFLIEDSPIDSYWGCGKDGQGKNMLGKLLMKLREELKGE